MNPATAQLWLASRDASPVTAIPSGPLPPMLLLALVLALGALALTAAVLSRLAEGLAIALPAPLHCKDCFDASELLLYTGGGENADGDLDRNRLRRQCALLAAGLRACSAAEPDLLPLRDSLLREAGAPGTSSEQLQKLVQSAVHTLQRIPLSPNAQAESPCEPTHHAHPSRSPAARRRRTDRLRTPAGGVRRR